MEAPLDDIESVHQDKKARKDVYDQEASEHALNQAVDQGHRRPILDRSRELLPQRQPEDQGLSSLPGQQDAFLSTILNAARQRADLELARGLIVREVLSRISLPADGQSVQVLKDVLRPPPAPPFLDPSVLLLHQLIQNQNCYVQAQDQGIILRAMLASTANRSSVESPSPAANAPSVPGGVDTTALQALVQAASQQKREKVSEASSVSSAAPSPTKSGSRSSDSHGSVSLMSNVPGLTLDPNRRCITMSTPSDIGALSEYQCLLRKQVHMFASTREDLEASAQGRNKPIYVGQIGLQCRHCAKLVAGYRPRGSVYFPTRLSGVYQAAQNMSMNHFNGTCKAIPDDIMDRLNVLKEKKSFVVGGGKKYWASCATRVGCVEAENGNGLVFGTEVVAAV